MQIGLVLSSTPAYSETFFNSKIKGLQNSGHSVQVFAQQLDPKFTLCTVVKAKKVYKWTVIRHLSIFWTLLVLVILHFGNLKRFVTLEKEQGSSGGLIIKRIYLNAHILSSRLDWLHFGFATQALGKENTAKAIKAKMAVSFRGFDINVYPLKHQDCYKLLWQRVDKVHSISNYLLQKAYALGLSKGIPYQIITPAVVMSDLPKSDPVSFSAPFQLTSIARLHWIKGLEVAIAAIAILKQKGIVCTYHIIGGGDIRDQERYKYQAYSLGVKEEVVFHGKLKHLETLQMLNIAHIYLQPSLNEGFCNAVLEAQAMGKLCIVSNSGGLPENIIDQETGWLVEKANPLTLANKIEMVIGLDNAQKEQITKSARERVAKRFNIKQQQQEFIEFYTIQ